MDRCTEFFHKLVSLSNTSRNIQYLTVDGKMVSDNVAIQTQIKQFFSKFYSETEAQRPVLMGLNLKKVDPTVAKGLEQSFTESEVWQALVDLSGDKSLGLDGFLTKFYKLCWHFKKKDVMRVVIIFSRSNFMDWRLNSEIFLMWIFYLWAMRDK